MEVDGGSVSPAFPHKDKGLPMASKSAKRPKHNGKMREAGFKQRACLSGSYSSEASEAGPYRPPSHPGFP
ncbi:hypothetical protein CBM2588_A160031 [Cupriavidus taiwanensis]|nr:hypothetical protein CBM2588_A160031 [Cupriavidus taiwanensis]